MGHSMGATIAPLALAAEPRYRAAVSERRGGELDREHHLQRAPPPRPSSHRGSCSSTPSFSRTLTLGDPALTLFQWAIEPADPLVYTSRIVREPRPGESPRHVLMEQGIVDHYILPPIANATSLSLGLDLAGVELDAKTPEIAGLEPLGSVLSFAGGTVLPLPVSGNIRPRGGTPDAAAVTAVVVQHPGDGIEDGHEIVFQTDPPKREYRCFLEMLRAGVPVVPAAGSVDAPCQP